MDVLRWILIALAIVVILGIYAWGKREVLMRWWAGDRDDLNHYSDDVSDDGEIADELLRLRTLMEGDVSDVQVRDLGTTNEVYEVEVSAPRKVKPEEVDVLLGMTPAEHAPQPARSVDSSDDVFYPPGDGVSAPRVRQATAPLVETKASPEQHAQDESLADSDSLDIGYSQTPQPEVEVQAASETEEEPVVEQADEIETIVLPSQQDLELPISAPEPTAEEAPAKQTEPVDERPRRKLARIIDEGFDEVGVEFGDGERADEANYEQNGDPYTPGLSAIGATLTGWGENVTSFCQKHIKRTKREAPVLDTPEEILVVHVMAHDGEFFDGNQIKLALKEAGLTLGKTGLYERLPTTRATTTPVLCVANMLEPGVLTDTLLGQSMQSPGLTLFSRLPGPIEGVDALEELLVTAQIISLRLGGEMRDQERNVLSKQTISLMHEQVVEHARQMRLALSRRR